MKWSRESDLNRRPAAYKAAALPTELSRLVFLVYHYYFSRSRFRGDFCNRLRFWNKLLDFCLSSFVCTILENVLVVWLFGF